MKDTTLSRITKAAEKAAKKTKQPNNPSITDKEIELGKLAFVNGAKFMLQEQKRLARKYYLKGALDADSTSDTKHIVKDFETHFELVYPIKE